MSLKSLEAIVTFCIYFPCSRVIEKYKANIWSIDIYFCLCLCAVRHPYVSYQTCHSTYITTYITTHTRMWDLVPDWSLKVINVDKFSENSTLELVHLCWAIYQGSFTAWSHCLVLIFYRCYNTKWWCGSYILQLVCLLGHLYNGQNSLTEQDVIKLGLYAFKMDMLIKLTCWPTG